MHKYKLGVVGATGVIGRVVRQVLEERKLNNLEYKFFASKKSAGSKINFLNKEYIVQELDEHSFEEKFDFAIFVAGGDISNKYAPIAKKNGCIVIDNSSTYRMDKEVPLVIPEVNPKEIEKNKGIIANPNCSTIQAVTVLKPLEDKYKIKRIIYSTYQAVSGAGRNGIADLENGIMNYVMQSYNSLENELFRKNKKVEELDVRERVSQNLNYELQKFKYPIFNNCIPQIDVFLENGYTKEEEKMINETRKILNKEDLKITATTVRVPVFNCHSEAINVEFEKNFDLEDLKEELRKFKSIVVIDDIQNEKYPLVQHANNTDKVYVGRIRRDFSVKSGVNLWVVADNTRKGAATNAVQILERLIRYLDTGTSIESPNLEF